MLNLHVPVEALEVAHSNHLMLDRNEMDEIAFAELVVVELNRELSFDADIVLAMEDVPLIADEYCSASVAPIFEICFLVLHVISLETFAI